MAHRITSQMIEEAKKITKYIYDHQLHQHDDCIRICYEWLDAQKPTKQANNIGGFKHLIENWAGRYVSASDFDVAVTLHPKFFYSVYNKVNVSALLVEPNILRLSDISEAMKHGYRQSHRVDAYNKSE